MAFFDYPIYNASLESERAIINTACIEGINQHANVPVDPGAMSTECVEVKFSSGAFKIVLLDYATVKEGLKSLFGIVDQNGNLT